MPESVIAYTDCLESLPRFAYQNLLTDSTVTPSAEVTGFEAENCYDDLPFTYWKPGTTSGASLAVDLGSSPEGVSAFCHARTNLADVGGTIVAQYSTASASGPWTNFAPIDSPADGGAVYRYSVAPVYAQWWRILVTGDPTPIIAALYLGPDFQMPLPVYVGMSPPDMHRRDAILRNQSERGFLTGSAVIAEKRTIQFDQDQLDPGWVRDTWEPFVAHAKVKYWWSLWSSVNRPDEGHLCWPIGDIPNSANIANGLMSVGIMGGALPRSING